MWRNIFCQSAFQLTLLLVLLFKGKYVRTCARFFIICEQRIACCQFNDFNLNCIAISCHHCSHKFFILLYFSLIFYFTLFFINFLFYFLLLIVFLFSYIGADYFGVRPLGNTDCLSYYVENRNYLWDPSTYDLTTDTNNGIISCQTFSNFCPLKNRDCFESEQIISGYNFKFIDLNDYSNKCLTCFKHDYIHGTIIFNAFIFCQVRENLFFCFQFFTLFFTRFNLIYLFSYFVHQNIL